MNLLLTNDDGIAAEGLRVLEEEVRRAASGKARVVTVAPAFAKSACSRSITVHQPVRCDAVGEDRYQLDGTPTDCVHWATKHLLPDGVSMVLSGINHGPNLADDIAYSGTVAAALEAARLGIPAIALSLAPSAAAPADAPFDFAPAARFAVEAMKRLEANPLPRGVALSANVPVGPIRGARVAPPGRRIYSDRIEMRTDPLGRDYYWMVGDATLSGEDEPGSDIDIVNRGFIALTPLDSDLHAAYTDMAPWTNWTTITG